MRKLLASAHTLDAIRLAIANFHCGAPITLIPSSDDTWNLDKTSDGTNLPGVRVIRTRNRLRFEMI